MSEPRRDQEDNTYPERLHALVMHKLGERHILAGTFVVEDPRAEARLKVQDGIIQTLDINFGLQESDEGAHRCILAIQRTEGESYQAHQTTAFFPESGSTDSPYEPTTLLTTTYSGELDLSTFRAAAGFLQSVPGRRFRRSYAHHFRHVSDTAYDAYRAQVYDRFTSIKNRIAPLADKVGHGALKASVVVAHTPVFYRPRLSIRQKDPVAAERVIEPKR